MQLSVIIVSYNVRYFLEQCLCSVQKAISGIDGEIIVIDNHSSDGTVEWLAPRFPAVRFISNAENLGFAKANNIAIALSKGNHILLLNPDTLVTENAFVNSLVYLDSHPTVGALGFRMIDGSGKFLPESKRSFPSPRVSFFKLSGLASLFPNSALFNQYALGNTDSRKNQAVDVLAGACMLVRQEVMKKLNGFDESYFMYGEDIDLSYRIQELGFANHYFADAEILHFKGASSRGQSIGHIKNFYGSMRIFVRKHYRAGSFLIQPAIVLRASVALVNRYCSEVFFKRKEKPLSAITTIVVCSAQEYEEILPALKGLFNEGKLPKRASCDLNTLEAFIKTNGIKAIIFCTGTLLLSDILTQVQLIEDKKTKFIFHLAGSEHIAVN